VRAQESGGGRRRRRRRREQTREAMGEKIQKRRKREARTLSADERLCRVLYEWKNEATGQRWLTGQDETGGWESCTGVWLVWLVSE
jgi:hypothetical protein